MRKLLILALLLLPAALTAQNAAMKKIAQTAREDNRVMHHLDILCNRFGGRPVGSDAYTNAAAWAAQCFRDWGYEVATEQVGNMSTGFNRGGWWGQMTGEQNMTLHFATPSYTSGTHGPQRGHVVMEPRRQEDFDRMKGQLKGAWVMVAGNSNGFALSHRASTKEGRHYIIEQNAENETYNRQNAGVDGKKRPIDTTFPALFYDEMIEAGALGFIRSAAVPIRALYDREVVQERIPFDSLPTTPDILLDSKQYDIIASMVRERRRVELEFDIRNYFKMGPVPYGNITATIKGSKHPDQYIIVGAHLDSYDVATGGVDCGSGTAAVMEAARMIALSGAKPDCSIIFILFAAEEYGLVGSKVWIQTHPDMIPNIKLMFNRDGGPLPYTHAYVAPSLVKHFEPTAALLRDMYPDYGFKIGTMDRLPKPTSYGGTDASSFAVAGVPTCLMVEEDVKGYNFSYGEIWHTERDTYAKSIPEYQQQAAAALALMVLAAADSPKVDNSEYYITSETPDKN